MIGALLGVPTADLPRFRGWIDALTSNSLTQEEFEATRDAIRGYMRKDPERIPAAVEELLRFDRE